MKAPFVDPIFRTIPEEEVVHPPPKQTSKKGKKFEEKSSKEFVKEKSTSSTTSEKTDKSELKEGDTTDELGSLSSKLLNKLAEEESKLKKTTNLEIGTWSNEMAEKADNLYDDEVITGPRLVEGVGGSNFVYCPFHI